MQPISTPGDEVPATEPVTQSCPFEDALPKVSVLSDISGISDIPDSSLLVQSYRDTAPKELRIWVERAIVRARVEMLMSESSVRDKFYQYRNDAEVFYRRSWASQHQSLEYIAALNCLLEFAGAGCDTPLQGWLEPSFIEELGDFCVKSDRAHEEAKQRVDNMTGDDKAILEKLCLEFGTSGVDGKNEVPKKGLERLPKFWESLSHGDFMDVFTRSW